MAIRWGYDKLCVFEDSDTKKGITNQSSRKRSIEVEYGKRCLDLHDKSVFCLQDRAYSTTRKALWDGMVAGCIPVSLSSVMSAEFEWRELASVVYCGTAGV